jgi:rod shape-determining protein MreC
MNRSNARVLIAATIILISAGLMILSISGYLTPIKSLVLRPIGGIQSWISLRVSALKDQLFAPKDITLLNAENARLQAEVARLQQEIISLREEASQAEVLAALLNYARSQPDSRSIAVNVIGRDVSPFLRSIWIGRGSDAGLAQGMPVVTDQGLVGRVSEVFPTVARVQLITDPETAVNVKLQISRSDGVLVAQPDGGLRVEMISQNIEVTDGELILTSGLGGKYPADIPIGQVLSVRRRDYEYFQHAVIQPTVDFDDLEIVLIITNFRPLPFEQPEP